jgi:hypothetical protein
MTSSLPAAQATKPSLPTLHWTEADVACTARWRSERDAPPPKRVVLADDTLTADTAYRLACEGTGLLWRGDFQNARQLLQALVRRVDKTPTKKKKKNSATPTHAYSRRSVSLASSSASAKSSRTEHAADSF